MQKVLIIDDDEDFALSLQNLLSLNNIPSLINTQGTHLDPLLQTPALGLALIDIRIHNLDGIEILQNIKRSYPELPCIMMTAYTEYDSVIKALQHGALNYLKKPIDPRQFIISVQQTLEKNQLLHEKKSSEQALLRSEENHRAVTENAPDGIICVDIHGKILFYNQRALNIFEHSPETFPQSPLSNLISPCHLPHEINKPFVYRATGTQGTGNNCPLEISVSAQFDPQIDTKYTIFVRDLTEKVKLEKELERSRLKAEEDERKLALAARLTTLGTLVAGIAHEINNPNNFILLNAGVLKQIWTDLQGVLQEYHQRQGNFALGNSTYEEIHQHLIPMIEGIHKGAERIGRITHALKDYASDRLPDLSIPIDMRALIDSAILLTWQNIKKSTHHFNLDIPDNLPKIYGNSQQLEQVLINLIENACHALTDPSQSIQIKARVLESDKLLEVCIEDQGRGVPEDIKPKIFDPFFTTRREIGGTGLGLALSFSIINNHKGTLEILSATDKPTQARVCLPITLP